MTVDGLQFTRQSNSFSDVIPGVAMTLTQTGDPQDLVLNNDTDATAKNLQGFVDAYNTIIKSVQAQLDVAPGSDRSLTLAGDSSIRGLPAVDSVADVDGRRQRVGAHARGPGHHDGPRWNHLSRQHRAEQGHRADPTDVNAVFSTATTGLSAVGGALCDTYTDPVSGVLTMRTQGLQSSVKTLSNSITEAQASADAYRTQLDRAVRGDGEPGLRLQEHRQLPHPGDGEELELKEMTMYGAGSYQKVQNETAGRERQLVLLFEAGSGGLPAARGADAGHAPGDGLTKATDIVLELHRCLNARRSGAVREARRGLRVHRHRADQGEGVPQVRARAERRARHLAAGRSVSPGGRAGTVAARARGAAVTALEQTLLKVRDALEAGEPVKAARELDGVEKLLLGLPTQRERELYSLCSELLRRTMDGWRVKASATVAVRTAIGAYRLAR